MPHTHAVAADLLAFLDQAAPACWRRWCPGDRLPRFIAGHSTFSGTRSALLRCLTALHGIGMRGLGDRSIADLVSSELARIRGADCKTWWSLYVLEALQAFGDRFDDHPLLAGFTEAQRAQLRQACDTTRVIDRETGVLVGHPNNYWLVVARCEQARLELGLTDDRTIYDLALANSRRVLTANHLHYMDDNEEGRGRYDIYAGHGLDATCELDDLADLRPAQAAAWERLVLATARPGGGSIAWGRSGGYCVVDDGLGKNSAILTAGLSSDAERLAGLIEQDARAATQDWWADDALNLHRHRRPHWYFGPGRLLECSFNHLTSLARATRLLRDHPPVMVCDDPARLYPEQDEWIAFDERGPGVWCYRSGGLDFQLPLVDGFTSDYVAAPVAPGCFEQVCDRGFPAGVPVVEMAGKRWLPLRRPDAVRHAPGELHWTTPCWSHLVDWDWWKGSDDLPGHRRVSARVVDGGLEIEEHWHFPEIPSAVGLWFAESTTPLQVDWHCDQPHATSVVVVEGMADWYSHHGPITRLHQIDIDPAAELNVRYRIQPRRD